MRDSTPAIHLRDIGSFHVGGRLQQLSGLPAVSVTLAQGGPSRSVDRNGTLVTGQMYVQRYLQVEPRHPLPVLLWHGGGMTGANWESTPDGRPGWLMHLLRSGFDVYVADAMERGRASWSPWPEVYESAPLFRTLEEGWAMFRMGLPEGFSVTEGLRVPHPGQQFPIDAFDRFAAQWVPRWVGHEAATLAAYEQLIRQVGRCIVIGHSQGGGFALQAARRWPEQIHAVVALEPSGAPSHAVSAEASAHASQHLVVWGDFIQQHPIWSTYRTAVDTYMRAISETGARVDFLDLPGLGIEGNSHFPMLDLNSELIAQRVVDWLKQVSSTAEQGQPYEVRA
jgi:pimeloyl-ACP methyl ester carboxylesterase